MSVDEDPNRIERVAVHEAGHALAAILVSRRFKSVEVWRRGHRAGGCLFEPRAYGMFRKVRGRDEYVEAKPPKPKYEQEILILLGGVAAELLVLGGHFPAGARLDIATALELSEKLAPLYGPHKFATTKRLIPEDLMCSDSAANHVRRLMDTTMVYLPKKAIEALADSLIRHRRLLYDEARRIVVSAVGPLRMWLIKLPRPQSVLSPATVANKSAKRSKKRS